MSADGFLKAAFSDADLAVLNLHDEVRAVMDRLQPIMTSDDGFFLIADGDERFHIQAPDLDLLNIALTSEGLEIAYFQDSNGEECAQDAVVSVGNFKQACEEIGRWLNMKSHDPLPPLLVQTFAP